MYSAVQYSVEGVFSGLMKITSLIGLTIFAMHQAFVEAKLVILLEHQVNQLFFASTAV